MSEKNYPELLKEIQSLDYESAEIQLFFVKTRPVGEGLSATLLSVESTKKLEKRFREIVRRRLEQANVLEKYEPETSDLDGGLLDASGSESNWAVIGEKLANQKVKPSRSAEELKGTDLLLARFRFSDDSALVVGRRLPTRLSPSRLKLEGLIWTQGEVELLDDESKVLNLTLKVDFLAWKDHVLVADKVEFEKAMNIRTGMIRKSGELVQMLDKSGMFEGTDQLKKAIGHNMTLLRRASKAHSSGNLEDAAFLTALIELVGKNTEWKIEMVDGKIVITKDNAESVLSLLNDARAETLIKKQITDILVGKVVGR